MMIENLTAENMLIIFAFVVAFYPLFWMIYRYGIRAEKEQAVAKTVSKQYEGGKIPTCCNCPVVSELLEHV